MTKIEMEHGFQRIWDMFAETDKKFEASRKNEERRDAEWHKKFEASRKKQEQRDAEWHKKFEASCQESEKHFAELRYLSQRTDAKVDALTGKWGRFVEGLVLPAVERLFAERGIPIQRVFPRAKARVEGNTLEIDILAVGAEAVIMIEVKSTLSVDDVKDHLDALRQFKTFFPEYAERKVLGAVAGIVVEENASRYAYQRGLFVIGQSGDTVCILNDAKFRPQAW